MWGATKRIQFTDIARKNKWETLGVLALFINFACVNKQLIPESSLVYGLSLTFIGFLIGFFLRLKAFRVISGTATSKIASAAQGFVEIVGQVVKTGTELRTPYSNLECAWYRHILEEKRIDSETRSVSWHLISEETSHLPISVSDGSGENVFLIPNKMLCLNIPGTVRIENDSTFFGIGDYRHTEYFLKEGDQVLINGAFATFTLNGLRAARHLLGIASELEQIKDIQKTLRYQVAQQLGLNGKTQIDEAKIHVITPCTNRKSGLLAYGREKDILNKKMWLILLSGFLTTLMLGITILAAEHYSEKAMNTNEKSHSDQAAAFLAENSLPV